MIDPNWSLVDLDPVTWRHLGRFFDPGQYIRVAQPGERGLFVLHERGSVLRIVDSASGVRRDLGLERIADPQQCAQELYARGEWERVHIIDKAHLADVARTVQATPRAELPLDEYYHLLYNLLWDQSQGYVCVPAHSGHWHGWTYQQIRNVLESLPSGPASLALGVFAEQRLIIGLIVVCERGQIRKLTTFEALPADSISAGLCEETMHTLWKQLAISIAPPAGVMLCTQEVFDAWIQQEEKIQVLCDARQQAQAYWRWSG